MTETAKSKLEKQAQDILDAAREAGLEESYFFETTFARYRRQLHMLSELEAAMDDGDVLVTKEYVKGRANLYANPAIAQYNSTADAANRTVTTLLRIVDAFRPAEKEESDEFLDYCSRR